jgi:regulator of sigma E protease
LVRVHEPEPFPTALRKGARDAGNMAFSIVGLLRNLISRRVGTAGFVGPPGIIAMSIRLAKQGGVAALLPFLMMLSVNLAVLNLLPIPPLDGGRLVFLAAEKIRGRPLPENAVAYPMIAGVVLIIVLFVVVSLKDVLSFF